MKPPLNPVNILPASRLPGSSLASPPMAHFYNPTPPLSLVGGDAAGGYPPPYDLSYVHHPPDPASHFTLEQQKIHTLFVSGLPDDVKPREIHNLFRRRPGFESCQLKYTGRGDQVVAFATFFNHQSAMAAMGALNGVIFDPQTGSTLHIELARSNSRTKHPIGGGVYTVIDKRNRVSNDDQEIRNDGDSGSDEPSGTDNASNKGGLSAVLSGDAADDTDGSPAAPREHLEEHSAGEIPPCSTLFIANLGPTCTEEELKQILSQCAGFQILKMRGKGGMPVAFADFTDVKGSTKAMEQLKGTLLPSSDRGGLHLEYARSKMRTG